MSKYDQLKREKEAAFEEARQTNAKFQTLADESYRVANIAHNANTLITDLDCQFAEATKLNQADVALLFLATGLQIARWSILSIVRPLSLDYKAGRTPRSERLTDTQGDAFAQKDIEAQKANEKKAEMVKAYGIKKSEAEKDCSDSSFRTVEQILFRPVPYDAMPDGNSNELNALLPYTQKLGGTNHRSFTLGHDPVWGWIFGPLNIITRSITFRSAMLTSFPVIEKGNTIALPQTNIISIFDNTIQSINQDKNRLTAATVKQALHFVSDKYTKGGLPIPLISAERAQSLMEQDWNSVEAEKWIKKSLRTFKDDSITVAIQFFLSFFINEIIRILHLLICSEEITCNPHYVEVRTRKILLTASVIASSSNVIYAAMRAYTSGNIISGAQVLDMGGIIETTHRLISDRAFISQVKQEFLENHWYELVMGEDSFYNSLLQMDC